MKKFEKNDKMLYIYGEVNELVENLKDKINQITYIQKRMRNVKKYELINALITIGLQHINESLDELGLIDISEEDLKDE